MSCVSNIKECKTCQGRGVTAAPSVEDRYRAYLDICGSAPMYSYSLNQRPVTLDTSWHRALYALRPGADIPRKIILLGDDDLTSVALSILDPDTDVHVLEADERLVGFINAAAQDHGLEHLSADVYNARDPAPDHLRGTADLTMCDPSSALFDLFLSRCLELNRRDGHGRIMTFAYPTYLGRDLALQQSITRMGLMIEALVPGFNRYHLYDLDIPEERSLVPRNSLTEETVAFVESLMLLLVTTEAQPVYRDVCELTDSALYGKKAAQRMLDTTSDPVTHQTQRALSKDPM